MESERYWDRSESEYWLITQSDTSRQGCYCWGDWEKFEDRSIFFKCVHVYIKFRSTPFFIKKNKEEENIMTFAI